MVNRPDNFDITTPTGASSPRSGDDELRKIKTYAQNAYNDLTQPAGVGVEHTDIYGLDVHASGQFEGNLAGNVTGDVDGNVTGDVLSSDDTIIVDQSEKTVTATGGFTGDLTGNATSADTLSTARTIAISGDATGTVQFNGSENVDISVTVDSVQENSVELGADTTGDYVEGITGTNNQIVVTAGSGEGSNPVISLPSGGLNVDITGTAATADKLETARTIGGVTFDGSKNINLPGVNEAGTQSTSGAAASAGQWTTARTITLQKAVEAAAGVTGSVSMDGSGNVVINTTLQGTVSQGAIASAAKWTTPRNLTFTGDVTTVSTSIDGSADVSIATSIAQNTVGAGELNVSGNGLTTQFLRSDGDGTMTWATPANTELTIVDGEPILEIADGELGTISNSIPANYLKGAGTGTSGQYLSSDGNGSMTWGTPANTQLTIAAGEDILSVTGGVLSTSTDSVTADYLKGAGNGTNGEYLSSDGDGNMTWDTPTDTTYSTFSSTEAGLVPAGGTGSTKFLRQDGTYVVPTDTDTTYSAASAGGLELDGSEFSIKDGGVGASMLANNSVGAAQIITSGVGTTELTNGAVTSAKMADNAIGALQLNVSGNGNNEQSLTSDADGSMTWQRQSLYGTTAFTMETGAAPSISGGTTGVAGVGTVALGGHASLSAGVMAFALTGVGSWINTAQGTLFGKADSDILYIRSPISTLDWNAGVEFYIAPGGGLAGTATGDGTATATLGYKAL